MLIEHLVFYLFSILLVFAGLMVITMRNPVHSALFLVLAFFASAGLWILLDSPFLALILILVYVGAVMTLFLFVVMMLNLDIAPERGGFVRYLPLGLLVMVLVIAAMVYVIGPKHFGLVAMAAPPHKGVDFSSVADIGSVLYTHYVYPFEIAAVILLVAIIATISLSLRPSRAKKQNIAQQLRVERHTRVRMVNMPVDKLQDKSGGEKITS